MKHFITKTFSFCQLISTVTDELKDEIQEDPYVSMGDEGKTIYTGIGGTMNIVQQRFTCCGVEGATDYTGSNYTINVAEMTDDAAKVSRPTDYGRKKLALILKGQYSFTHVESFIFD